MFLGKGAGNQLGLNGSVPATCYPTASAISNSWDPALDEKPGEHLGVAAASCWARASASNDLPSAGKTSSISPCTPT